MPVVPDLGGTVVERVLRVGDKSLLALGHRDGRPVVVKALTTTDPFWRERFAHEIAVYRALAETPSPAPTPALIHTDGERLLVLDRLPGRPLDADRYPARHLIDVEVTAAIEVVRSFATWHPPPGVLAPVFGYRDRIERYRGGGRYLGDDAAVVLHRLLDQLGNPSVPAHGDPLPANLLVTDTGSGDVRCGLVDFEFTGLFLPGLDLAMLHTLLTGTPGAQDRIRAVVADERIERAFLVNQAMVLTRELRIHRELDDGPLRRNRLTLIEPQIHDLIHELHGLTEVR